jgi:hypothetical protein
MKSHHLKGILAALLILFIGFFGSAGFVEAHHSIVAIFDAKKPVELKGTIAKMEWINPHALLYLDVKADTGNVVTWMFEMGSPNTLNANGLTKGSLKTGDTVMVTGSRARDGSFSARAHSLTMADSKRVFNAENIEAK